MNLEHNGIYFLWFTTKPLRELERDFLVGEVKALRRETSAQVMQLGEVNRFSGLILSLASQVSRGFVIQSRKISAMRVEKTAPLGREPGKLETTSYMLQ
jgi:hypothetical protein